MALWGVFSHPALGQDSSPGSIVLWEGFHPKILDGSTAAELLVGDLLLHPHPPPLDDVASSIFVDEEGAWVWWEQPWLLYIVPIVC